MGSNLFETFFRYKECNTIQRSHVTPALTLLTWPLNILRALSVGKSIVFLTLGLVKKFLRAQSGPKMRLGCLAPKLTPYYGLLPPSASPGFLGKTRTSLVRAFGPEAVWYQRGVNMRRPFQNKSRTRMPKTNAWSNCKCSNGRHLQAANDLRLP